MRKIVFDACVAAFVRGSAALEDHSTWLLFGLGIIILSAGPTEAQAASKYGAVCNNILKLFEGEFGSLCTAAAGIGAVCAAAMGGFKMAWTLIVVSVGSFLLRDYTKVFFSDCTG